MAVGTQFSDLVIRLKAELKRVADVSVGIDDRETLKEGLNHQYRLLYMQRDWAHLRKVFSVSLVAGQYQYDMPDGLNDNRVERVTVKYGDIYTDVTRGIDFEQYAAYDSADNERSDPVQFWDVRWTGPATQIEVWPRPASAQTLYLKGIQAVSRLVDDDDVCLLDDDLVVLFTAAELTRNENDRKVKLSAAQAHLQMLSARMRGGGMKNQLGLGNTDNMPAPKVTVRVAG
jgi:hypothetical protein